MRIALFHSTLPQEGRKLGGVEVAVHRLAQHLVSSGEVDVTVHSLDDAPAGALYDHHRIDVPARARGNVGRSLVVPLVLNRRLDGDPDLVHLHGDDWFYLRRAVPTVRTLHGSALREAQTATSLRRKGYQYSVYPLEKLSARLADVTLAVGRDAMRLYGADHLVDNGVDLTRFHPGPRADHPLVLFVGTWQGRKRGHLVHRAFTEVVRPAFPDAELVMVSDHADPAPGVRHVPHASDEELAQLYSSAWLFAYPSAYEGFGIPYVEAMASGTPVLATPNDGADHVLADGRFGVIATAEGFGAAALELLRDQSRRDQLAAAGLERAEHFSWDRVARWHIDLYRRVVRGER